MYAASVHERSTAYPVIHYSSVHDVITSTPLHPNPVQRANVLATGYQDSTHPHSAPYQLAAKNNRQNINLLGTVLPPKVIGLGVSDSHGYVLSQRQGKHGALPPGVNEGRNPKVARTSPAPVL